MTMVPSMSRLSISERMASTATWSEYLRSPWPMVRAECDGGPLDDADELERQVVSVHFLSLTVSR